MLDEVRLAVGDVDSNAAITEWCRRQDVEFMTGPEENLLERHRILVAESNCDVLVRITGDCPFVPTSEIDRLVNRHQGNGARYTTNNTSEMPVGTAIDVVDEDLLSELAEVGATHPVQRLREFPADWSVEFSDNPAWHEFGRAHTAVDTPEDYWRLVDAFEAVGSDPKQVAKWITERE